MATRSSYSLLAVRPKRFPTFLRAATPAYPHPFTHVHRQMVHHAHGRAPQTRIHQHMCVCRPRLSGTCADESSCHRWQGARPLRTHMLARTATLTPFPSVLGWRTCASRRVFTRASVSAATTATIRCRPVERALAAQARRAAHNGGAQCVLARLRNPK